MFTIAQKLGRRFFDEVPMRIRGKSGAKRAWVDRPRVRIRGSIVGGTFIGTDSAGYAWIVGKGNTLITVPLERIYKS